MMRSGDFGIFSNTKWRITVAALACAVMAGCAPTFNQAGAKDPNAGVASVNAQPLQIKVPKDTGVHPRSVQGLSVVVRDLTYSDKFSKDAPVVKYSTFAGQQVVTTYSNSAAFSRVLFESPQNDSFTVHSRKEDGAGSSGVRFRIQYTITDEPDGYTVNFKPVTRQAYQYGMNGLMHSVPLPDFKVTDVYDVLARVSIVYRFEVDTPYPTDSITANFMRSTAVQQITDGYKDPVTGKVISTAYQLPMGDTMVRFSVDAYPYRNGSKAVITALIPGRRTGATMVEFKNMMDEVEKAVTTIAQS